MDNDMMVLGNASMDMYAKCDMFGTNKEVICLGVFWRKILCLALRWFILNGGIWRLDYS